eukprot:XP_001707370.1 Hypothetical protein GL50803_26954 [Giardia lamblia ATCC 50803]
MSSLSSGHIRIAGRRDHILVQALQIYPRQRERTVRDS